MVSTYIYIYYVCTCGSVHSDSLMVPHGSQQSDITLEEEGDANEHLYQKRFEEGYDEEYVKG